MVQPSTLAKWRAIVARHDSSGLTIKDFAKREGVNAGTLAWWRSRLRKLDASNEISFAEVVMPAEDASEDATVVLAMDNLDVHVVVDRSTNLQLLRDVLEALC